MTLRRVRELSGKGLRPSLSSLALFWDRIGDTVYYTFDDHPPVSCHRCAATTQPL